MSQKSPRPAARRARLVGGLTALVLGIVPAGAAADQITSLRVVNGEAVVDRPIVFEVQGAVEGEYSSYIAVDINPQGVPCAATHELNANGRVDTEQVRVSKGAFAGVRVDFSLESPGPRTACAYVYESAWPDDRATVGPVSLAFDVRNPSASLSMSLLGAAVPGQSVPLSVVTHSEVRRELRVDLNNEGVPCGLNASVNNGDTVLSGLALLGGPTTTVSNIGLPYTAGRYHLCGYIGRDSWDATPLVVVDSGTFLVGTPPAPPAPIPAPKASCTIGPRTVASRGTLGIRCKNTSGSVEIRAKRGGRTVKVTRRLVGGVAKVRVKTLRIKRGVTKISVFQGRAKLAGRSVRRR